MTRVGWLTATIALAAAGVFWTISDAAGPSRAVASPADDPRAKTDQATAKIVKEDRPTGPWAHLTGRFVVDGKVDPPKALKITQDVAVFGKLGLKDESLVVSAGGGLANVFVYLRRSAGVKVHPDYGKSAKDDVVLLTKGGRFQPHACLVRTSQTLKIKNVDPVAQNANIQSPQLAFSNLLAAGKITSFKLTVLERLPIAVNSNIHPWMRGYLLVQDHPYMAVTDAEGRFKIRNLPADTELEIQLWHEKAGYLDLGRWHRGRIGLKLSGGQVKDLGTVKVPAEMLK